MVDAVDQLKKFARTHERGFPQTLLYTKEHHQADLAVITEIERLRVGIKRLSDEEEFCAETTGDDPFSLVYFAAKLATAEAENSALRHIISDAASAIGNGAFIAPTCSIEFMSGLPKEIRLHIISIGAEPRSLSNEALHQFACEMWGEAWVENEWAHLEEFASRAFNFAADSVKGGQE